MAGRYPQGHQHAQRARAPHYPSARSQSRGVPAQLPQLHPSHVPQASHASQASQAQHALQASRQRQGSNSEGARPKGRGRPPTERPAPASEEQIGLTAEQRSEIQRYIELDNQISQLNNQLKGLRAERKGLEDSVLAIIRPLRSASVRTRDNVVLRAKKKMTKEGLNQKFWVRKLAESGQLADSSRAEALVKSIYKNRESTEDYELVRE